MNQEGAHVCGCAGVVCICVCKCVWVCVCVCVCVRAGKGAPLLGSNLLRDKITIEVCAVANIFRIKIETCHVGWCARKGEFRVTLWVSPCAQAYVAPARTGVVVSVYVHFRRLRSCVFMCKCVCKCVLFVPEKLTTFNKLQSCFVVEGGVCKTHA
jgi:hypothetical protein